MFMDRSTDQPTDQPMAPSVTQPATQPMATVTEIVRRHARERGDRLALRYANDGRAWTFAELHDASSRVANALRAAGVERGDRIAYLDRNAPEYYLYFFGGAKIDAVNVAVNWRLAPREMAHILDDSGARVLLVGEEFLEHLRRVELEHVRQVVVIGDPGASGYPSFAQWIAGFPAEDPALDGDAEAPCYQLYTSGTTGLPKGVELTHANLLHCLDRGLAEAGFDADAVNLVCMPLFHIAGSGWGLVGMYRGARTVMLRDVDPEAIVRTIPEEGVTHALFVPAVLQFLLDLPGIAEADFSTLRAITYGASPITERVLVDAMRTFQCGFLQAYGLTETTGAICVLAPEDHDPGGPRAHLLRSCGRPVANHEVRIVDTERGVEVPEGEVGEIWVRGPQNMKAYWRNPEATAATLVEGGWLRTGDAGYVRGGYVFIHDRVKDMIISGAENVYPAEVENVLMEHDGIRDAAVIGVPSERWGETVKALIVRGDAALEEHEVIGFCRERLAHYKCPTSVDWVESIPRNPSGKILKAELREPYWRGHTRRVS